MADELYAWKRKLDIVFGRWNPTEGDNVDMDSPFLKELRIIVMELDHRVEIMRTACPKEWELQRTELDTRFEELRARLEALDLAHSAGPVKSVHQCNLPWRIIGRYELRLTSRVKAKLSHRNLRLSNGDNLRNR